jgi:rod shape-determining protein MreD
MRRFFISFIITGLFGYLQTTWLSKLSWLMLGVTPDFSLIFLSFFALHFGQLHGTLIGFSTGLLEDSLSVAPLGFYALIKMTVGMLVGLLKNRIALESQLMAFIVVSIATFLKYIIALIIAQLAPVASLPIIFLGQTFLFELVVNNIIAIPLFYIFKFFMKKLSPLWRYEGRDNERFK